MWGVKPHSSNTVLGHSLYYQRIDVYAYYLTQANELEIVNADILWQGIRRFSHTRSGVEPMKMILRLASQRAIA